MSRSAGKACAQSSRSLKRALYDTRQFFSLKSPERPFRFFFELIEHLHGFCLDQSSCDGDASPLLPDQIDRYEVGGCVTLRRGDSMRVPSFRESRIY